MTPETPKSNLERELSLCNDLEKILLRENEALREGRVPDHDLLEEKRLFLPLLQSGVESIRSIRWQSLSSQDRDGLKELKAQLEKQFLKLVMLDKENEKLLLRLQSGGAPRGPSTSSGPSQGLRQIQDAYRRQLRENPSEEKPS